MESLYTGAFFNSVSLRKTLNFLSAGFFCVLVHQYGKPFKEFVILSGAWLHGAV